MTERKKREQHGPGDVRKANAASDAAWQRPRDRFLRIDRMKRSKQSKRATLRTT